MAHRPDDRPVVGLFEDGAGADQAAREIRACGIRAGVTSSTEVAEGRVGRHLGHGLVIGVLIALPFAIVLPPVAWARSSAWVTSLLFASANPLRWRLPRLGESGLAPRWEVGVEARARQAAGDGAGAGSGGDRPGDHNHRRVGRRHDPDTKAREQHRGLDDRSRHFGGRPEGGKVSQAGRTRFFGGSRVFYDPRRPIVRMNAYTAGLFSPAQAGGPSHDRSPFV